MNVLQLADEIIGGRRLNRSDDLLPLMEADLEDLKEGADRIRKALLGDHVDMCTIISGRSGHCTENCKFCAQSAYHHTNCEVHGLLDPQTILENAKANEAQGVGRFAIVNSGHHPSDRDFKQILETFRLIKKESKIKLCASLGFLSSQQFEALKEAGVTSIHNNIESSREFFPKICSTHTFDEKIENIKRAQAAGLSVCSGGIIGLGESFKDRVQMALTLQELHITSIPINSLMPIKGTPLENQRRLREDEILRTIALFRYINPKAHIRLAGGRALMKDNGREAFLSGASASITGNMLTTSGSTIANDQEMFTQLKRDCRPVWQL